MADGARNFDIEAIRADFPILGQQVHGKRLAFLDSAASAQKPRQAVDAEVAFINSTYANIHRGIYQFSADGTELYEEARNTVQRFINAKHAHECIFVRGATEGINLVANTWGRANIKAGDEIILSTLEHHSNIVPWQMVAEATGAVIRVIPVLDDGQIDYDAYLGLLSDRTKLVAVAHISNALGTLLPVADIIRTAHDRGAVVLLDGCQAAPHMALDMQALDADFYVFSAHKTYGPTGIGVLYGKEALLEAMPPWQGGGDMIETVSFERTTYNGLPHKFEAGTPHITGGIGFKAALDYMSAIGFAAIEAHEQELMAYAMDRLRGYNDIRLIGTAADKRAVISFVMDMAHPHDIGTVLDRAGVAVRVGHHCAQPIMDRFAVPGTVRASFGLYNNQDDIDQLIAGLDKVRDLFV